VGSVTESAPAAAVWRGRISWARNRSAPRRAFLQTESGSAGVVVAATRSRWLSSRTSAVTVTL
jgi:hypothetical protein